MARVLIIAEHDDTSLNVSTARCVRCAVDIGSDVDVAILGSSCMELAQEAAALSGVKRVLTVEHAANSPMLAAVWAPQVATLAGDYTHVLGPSTTFGKDLMPRVAALLGVGQVSDIMTVLGPYRFERPIYAGNAVATVAAAEDRKLIATVRTASYPPADGNGSAPIEPRPIDVTLPNHTRHVGRDSGDREGPDLQTATRVVSGGRALGSRENFALIDELAAALDGATGASRAAVDSGFVTNELQVGQTGKIIAPELYIAVGISGAIQHITGIKDAGTIVAINRDEDAPIFDVADLGLVADLFQVVPELTAAIKALRERT